MGFDRQLDVLMAALAAVVVLVGCVFWIGISFKVSLLVSALVLFAGLIFGRAVSRFFLKAFQ